MNQSSSNPNSKNQKTNWKYLSLLLILFLIASGGVIVYSLSFLKEEINPLEIIISNKKDNLETDDFFMDLDKKIAELENRILEEKEVVEFLPYETERTSAEIEGYMGRIFIENGWDIYYKYGKEKFKVEIIPQGQDKHGNIFYNYILKVYDTGNGGYKSVEEREGSGLEVFAYVHNDDLVLMWWDSGRIGCCSLIESNTALVYNFVSKRNIVKTTSYESLNENESSPPTDFSLFLVEDILYLKSENEISFRFGKGYSSVSAADKYYLVENGEFKESSEKFKDTYLMNAYKIQEVIGGENWSKSDKNWPSFLIDRTFNLILAGEESIAWKTFNTDFYKFSEKYPSEITKDLAPDEIKRGVQQQLSRN